MARYRGFLCVSLLAAAGCGEAPELSRETPEPELLCGEEPNAAVDTPYPRGLHVVGNRIEDAEGNTIVLRGVNRSGSEYRCIQGFGIFDGPDDETSVRAIASWNVNAVRVPLNEGCWLGIQEAKPEFSGCNYKNAIRRYVAQLHKYQLIPILDLHWAAPNIYRPVRLQPMPNADNSPAFWADVAKTFKDDDGVVFEPYNEPFPGQNSDDDYAWRCYRDGCHEDVSVGSGEATGMVYRTAGMQTLVTAIRDAGARNLLLLGGVRYSNALSQWFAYKPEDPLQNIAAAWHVYNYNQCVDAACWDAAPASVSAEVPLVATEVGQNDCLGDFVSPLLDWLDQRGAGYLAWSWNAYGQCRAAGSGRRGSPWSLVTDYESATPNSAYAQAFHEHLQRVTTDSAEP